jgi:hypothetical protein
MAVNSEPVIGYPLPAGCRTLIGWPTPGNKRQQDQRAQQKSAAIKKEYAHVLGSDTLYHESSAPDDGDEEQAKVSTQAGGESGHDGGYCKRGFDISWE